MHLHLWNSSFGIIHHTLMTVHCHQARTKQQSESLEHGPSQWEMPLHMQCDGTCMLFAVLAFCAGNPQKEFIAVRFALSLVLDNKLCEQNAELPVILDLAMTPNERHADYLFIRLWWITTKKTWNCPFESIGERFPTQNVSDLIMRKAFPCHDVIIHWRQYFIWMAELIFTWGTWKG